MGKLEGSTVAGTGALPTTQWSRVLLAGQPDSTEAREALAQLCQAYWYPVYAFIRRRGHDRDQAKDLTQELFARLIEKRSLDVADQLKGRFRSFLLTCVDHFLNNERKKEQALKRGGQFEFVSLDADLAERRYVAEPADPRSPEHLFERRWALALLDQAFLELQREYEESGRRAHFEALQIFLSGAKGVPASYADIGGELNLSEAAARQASHRLRRRFGELLRMHVAQTVASPTELEAELAHFRIVLNR